MLKKKGKGKKMYSTVPYKMVRLFKQFLFMGIFFRNRVYYSRHHVYLLMSLWMCFLINKTSSYRYCVKIPQSIDLIISYPNTRYTLQDSFDTHIYYADRSGVFSRHHCGLRITVTIRACRGLSKLPKQR